MLETLDMVSQERRQNVPEISLWENLLRHRWTKTTVHDLCLNATEKENVLKKMNKERHLILDQLGKNCSSHLQNKHLNIARGTTGPWVGTITGVTLLVA